SRRAPQEHPWLHNCGEAALASQTHARCLHHNGLPVSGRLSAAYWSESQSDRMELLKQAIVYMNEHRWGKVLDSGWFRWDIAVYCGAGLILNLVTAQEEHGSGRRLMRVRFRLTPSGLHKLAALTILTAAASAAFTHPWLGLALAL